MQAYLEKVLAIIDLPDGILTQRLTRAKAEIKSAEEGLERIAQKEARKTTKVHLQVPQ